MGYVFGWVCIGLAAAVGAWTWPFRRGVAGIAMNATCAVVGAVGTPALAVALGMPLHDPWGLPLSAAGALVLLGVAHLAWSVAREARPRARHHHP